MLYIRPDCTFKNDPIPLTTVRPFVMETVCLKKTGIPPEEEEKVSTYLTQKVCVCVKSFTELGPQLLRLPGVKYLLSKVFSQDPFEQYFSRQHHCGGTNKNSTANQVPYNTTRLVQQQSMYHDLKTMNVEAGKQITHSFTASSNIQETTMHTNKPKLVTNQSYMQLSHC